MISIKLLNRKSERDRELQQYLTNGHDSCCRLERHASRAGEASNSLMFGLFNDDRCTTGNPSAPYTPSRRSDVWTKWRIWIQQHWFGTCAQSSATGAKKLQVACFENTQRCFAAKPNPTWDQLCTWLFSRDCGTAHTHNLPGIAIPLAIFYSVYLQWTNIWKPQAIALTLGGEWVTLLIEEMSVHPNNREIPWLLTNKTWNQKGSHCRHPEKDASNWHIVITKIFHVINTILHKIPAWLGNDCRTPLSSFMKQSEMGVGWWRTGSFWAGQCGIEQSDTPGIFQPGTSLGKCHVMHQSLPLEQCFFTAINMSVSDQ